MMRTLSPRLPLLLLFLAPPLVADAHKWEVQEVFSNADGTVQFIEWFNTDPDENLLLGETVSTASGGFMAFPANLSTTDTAGRTLLLATPAFAAIPEAPTPDFIIPAGFLNPLGDTITYSGGDVMGFGPLPADGRSSLSRSGATGTNSPRNFAGSGGSIWLANSAVRNGGGVNPLCYTADVPVLGTMWTGRVDASVSAQPAFAAILGFEGASSGTLLSSGELLLDTTSPLIFVLVQFSSGGIDELANAVPPDPALIGFSLATQGAVLGGGITTLCNAVDLTLGR